MVLQSIPKTDIPRSPSLSKIDERFIITIQGRDFVKYDGLLDLSHQRGLTKLEVEAIQLPSTENGNTAICKAVAHSEKGETFMDIGDANPGNVNRMIAPHILRMASTRAKARVLRDFCNIGITCLEELGDMDDALPSGKRKEPRKASSLPTQPAPAPKEKPLTKEETPPTSEEAPATGITMSEAQRRAIDNLAKRRGIKEEELMAMAKEMFDSSVLELTPQHAASFIRALQQSA